MKRKTSWLTASKICLVESIIYNSLIKLFRLGQPSQIKKIRRILKKPTAKMEAKAPKNCYQTNRIHSINEFQ